MTGNDDGRVRVLFANRLQELLGVDLELLVLAGRCFALELIQWPLDKSGKILE
jgi:hypothetical protein